MASKKSKANHPTQANGVPAANAVTETVASGTDAPATPVAGTKLRWTSLKAAAGAHRTKKPKTKKATSKAQTKDDAPTTGKLSALNAAAKVLQEAGRPMNCQEMIQTMAAKSYWTSPAGQTPAATLYSAIAREIKTKGSQARFLKTARGQFSYQTPQAS